MRRYERDHPGELPHVDVKKIGRIRDGGGWRTTGRGSTQSRQARYGARVGFEYVHCAVDDHNRLAYAEVLPEPRAGGALLVLLRAAEHCASSASTGSSAS